MCNAGRLGLQQHVHHQYAVALDQIVHPAKLIQRKHPVFIDGLERSIGIANADQADKADSQQQRGQDTNQNAQAGRNFQVVHTLQSKSSFLRFHRGEANMTCEIDQAVRGRPHGRLRLAPHRSVQTGGPGLAAPFRGPSRQIVHSHSSCRDCAPTLHASPSGTTLMSALCAPPHGLFRQAMAIFGTRHARHGQHPQQAKPARRRTDQTERPS